MSLVGATLTLLVKPTDAPMVQMQLPRIKDRVNACYGYNAISRITLTQTAAMGFAEGQAQFTAAPRAAKPQPGPETRAKAHAAAEGCADAGRGRALRRRRWAALR